MALLSRIGLFALAAGLLVGESQGQTGRRSVFTGSSMGAFGRPAVAPRHRPVSGVVGVFGSFQTNAGGRAGGPQLHRAPSARMGGIGTGISGRGIGTGISGAGIGTGMSGMGIGMGATGRGIGTGMSGMGIGMGASGRGIGTGLSGRGIGMGRSGTGIGGGSGRSAMRSRGRPMNQTQRSNNRHPYGMKR
jgi:hypothetical protein